MRIPPFEITVWAVGHRDGFLVNVDSEFPDSGCEAYRQPTLTFREPVLDMDAPYSSRRVSDEWLAELVRRLDRAAVSLADPVYQGVLSGSRYGLRLERGLQEITVRWSSANPKATQLYDLWQFVASAVDS